MTAAKSEDERPLASRLGEKPTKVPLSEMSVDVLWCRQAHDWGWSGDTVTTRRGYLMSFWRKWTCNRCTAWKEVEYDDHCSPTGRKRMNYPPGFLSSEGRLHHDDVRYEQMNRLGYRLRPKTVARNG